MIPPSTIVCNKRSGFCGVKLSSLLITSYQSLWTWGFMWKIGPPGCKSQIQHPPRPSLPLPPPHWNLPLFVCVSPTSEFVSHSNLFECHIFSTSSRAKQTHNLPTNFFLYCQFIKETLDGSEWPRLGNMCQPWTMVWLHLLSNRIKPHADVQGWRFTQQRMGVLAPSTCEVASLRARNKGRECFELE